MVNKDFFDNDLITYQYQLLSSFLLKCVGKTKFLFDKMGAD
jgi:hypothetical protein